MLIEFINNEIIIKKSFQKLIKVNIIENYRFNKKEGINNAKTRVSISNARWLVLRT